MEPFAAFVVGVLAGVIGTVAIGTMSMKRSYGPADEGETPQQNRPRTSLRTADEAQRLSKIWHLIWVWIYDSDHPNQGTEAGDGSGDYYLRPVLQPEDTDLQKSTIITFRWSQRRKCYMMDQQYHSLGAIPDNKGHEMSSWYAHQATRMQERLAQPDGPGVPDVPGREHSWPNLSEMIDGIDLTERNTQGTPQIQPPPPARIIIKEEQPDR